MSDDDFARLGKAQSLRGLILSSESLHMPSVTDKGLENLFSQPVGTTLWYLELWSDLPNVTEEGYLSLNKGQALQTLYLQLPPGKGAFLSRLKLRMLDHLGVVGEGIPRGLLDGLPSRMPDLRILHVRGARPAAAEVQALAELDLLTIVRLVDCGLNDSSLEFLGKLQRLTELNLDLNSEITDRGVAHLARLTGLDLLGLDRAAVGDEACKTLASLPALADLNLNQTRVKDSGLAALAALKPLKRLTLQSCRRITDKGLDSLATIHSLADLNLVDNPQISAAAVRKLRVALPKCKITSDYPDLAAAIPNAQPAASDNLAKSISGLPGTKQFSLIR